MASQTFSPDQEWLRSVLPDGIPRGETTLISGPGGSGKPLIGFSLVDVAAAGGDITSLFSVSTSAFEDQIARVEDAADTVLMTRMDEMTLYLRGERSASVPISEEEVSVPFTPDQIRRIKSVAEETRDTTIPTIKGL